ncbi:MAG: prephenate dehydrogenase/arogenate dehydrogenase family protein [Lachnospiraceae bacterium]|nr:prephenate dehydrogenase/arogenate dehydrogenase family protein [Lachnospiraceae bacterium]
MFSNDSTFGFIGLGLIGGSIARAIRHNYPDADIIAYNRYDNKTNPNLLLAYEDRTLTGITNDLKEIAKTDCIFLCAPVLSNIDYLSKLKPYLGENTLITDVGSVKNDIAKAVLELGLTRHFIGGHPMTGMEKTGYQNSSISLLRGSFYILTPTDDTPASFVETMTDFVDKCGSKPFVVSSERHDEVVAAISHGPHVIAACLVNLVKEDDTDGHLKTLAAGGFKDITRIASSSPEMWHDICISNKEALVQFLRDYNKKIENSINAIENANDEEIYNIFKSSKSYRDNIKG